MGKLRDAIDKKLKKESKEAERKGEVRIYDSKKKEHFYPSERRAESAKKEALKKIRERKESPESVGNAIIKSLSDRLNNATTDEEREKAQKRLDKYKDSMSSKG